MYSVPVKKTLYIDNALYSYDPSKVKSYVMSDSIVYYICDSEPYALASLIIASDYLMCQLALNNTKPILIRGAITHGELYRENNIIFGPALTRANNLESKFAIYPKIIIDGLLNDEIKTIQQFSANNGNDRHYNGFEKNYVGYDNDDKWFYLLYPKFIVKNKNKPSDFIKWLEEECQKTNDERLRKKFIYLLNIYY